VVYRRVLRYYSGEEDGLGKLLGATHLRHIILGFSVLMLLLTSFIGIFLRYEKGVITRRRQEVHHTTEETNYTR
jgi:hypothetical protein